MAIMRRSCSDSTVTASQMDGVFGSDNGLRASAVSVIRYRNSELEADQGSISALFRAPDAVASFLALFTFRDACQRNLRFPRTPPWSRER
jgi:hypothetical protein